VIAGDAIDFHQAWSMSRVLKAHARLIGELSRMAESGGVTYIWGNHDYDISLFRDLLRFDVCSTLYIGDEVIVRHGYEYDPFIGPNLEQTHVATRVHHLIERVLDSWIRLPLENHYTFETRLAFWLFHKLAWSVQLRDQALRWLGRAPRPGDISDVIQYWSMNQIGDPACVFENVRAALSEGPHRYIVTGHSHLPGMIEVLPDRYYINTGSWTFGSAQYARWDGERFEVRDWISGKQYRDEAYQPLHDRRFHHMDFLAWWRENYLGWLRFRTGEEGRIPSRIFPPAQATGGQARAESV
ncbi:MAG: hypothetical protein AAFV53_19440, partial [Myxococcota bacterium]